MHHGVVDKLVRGLVLAACTGAAQAAVLAAIGPTYPIAEENLLASIRSRLQAKQAAGEIARLQQEALARASKQLNDPPPVAGLVTASKPRTHYFDPTIVLDRNIVDSRGAVLYPSGTTKNPLDVVSLSSRLLFFDARDRRQVARATAVLATAGDRIKPVLVGGSPLQLMRQLRRPVYFDQGGVLVQQLGIRAVPAMVSQDGQRLRIDEMVAP
jgi:conjugal transfer pilus assembly protein TraW